MVPAIQTTPVGTSELDKTDPLTGPQPDHPECSEPPESGEGEDLNERGDPKPCDDDHGERELDDSAILTTGTRDAELNSSPVSTTRESQPHCPPVDWNSYGIGALIGGKYRLEWRLGLGGMGIVWAARHVELEELVAIKCIRPDVQNDENTVQRFAREAKACARLRSEHIVRAFDVGIDEVFGPFIVLEYLDGQDLGQLLRTVGPFPVSEACGYVLQACEALAVSHSNGIVHRDLKPSNLFRISRGELTTIKLLDFGTSKASLTGNLFGGDLSLADKTAFLGTPMYMSPEQITPPQTVDHRSDVWSLGCVLYELVSGRPAFAAEDLAQVCEKVVRGEAPRLTSDAADPLLEGVQRVIDRCLAKDPGDRYIDVAELAQELVPLSDAESQVHSHRASSLLKCGLLPPSSRRPDVAVSPPSSASHLTLAEVPHVEEPFGARALSAHRDGKRAGRRRWRFAMALALAVGAAAGFALVRARLAATTEAVSHRTPPRPAEHGPVLAAPSKPGGLDARNSADSTPSFLPLPALEPSVSHSQEEPTPAAPEVDSARGSAGPILSLDLPGPSKRPRVEKLRSRPKSVVPLRRDSPATEPAVSVPRLADESKIRLLQ